MRTIVGLALVVSLFVPTVAWCKIGGGEVSYRPAGANPVVYSHDAHVTKAGLKCSECHYKLYTIAGHRKKFAMDEMAQGKSCGACHNGKRTFDVTSKDNCKKCHK